MIKEKEEALRQINEIKNHLVDKQTFFPYNYNATYIWAIIAVMMTLFIIPIYQISITKGTLVSFVLICLGFLIEGVMTKRVNKSYDIEDCTYRQQFIMKSFIIVALFLIVISAILAKYGLYIPILLSWLFLISCVYFSVGFVLNIDSFSKMAYLNMILSIILLSFGLLSERLEEVSTLFFYMVQFFLILGLALLPSFIAWQQIKNENQSRDV